MSDLPEDLDEAVGAARAELADAVDAGGLRRDPLRFVLAALSSALAVFPTAVRRVEAASEVVRQPLSARAEADLLRRVEEAAKRGAAAAGPAIARRTAVVVGLSLGAAATLGAGAGWWAGRDIEWRAQTGQMAPDATLASEQAAREIDRGKLWSAFEYAGVADGSAPPMEQGAAVVDAAIRFVAATPAPLAIVPVEDIAGLVEQPNLPGTIDEHPNWRRRLPATAETLLAAPAAAARLAMLRRERSAT